MTGPGTPSTASARITATAWRGWPPARRCAWRWGQAGPELINQAAWEIEAEYLALALMNMICLLSPQRVVVGGGVAKHPALLPLARKRLPSLLGGYLSVPELTNPEKLDSYIVAPRLGDCSGVVGAIEMAREAADES